MEEINPSKYTAAQLRSWLQNLNLPTAGTKNALLLRLNGIPENLRGVCPIDGGLAAAGVVCSDEGEFEDGDIDTVDKGKQMSGKDKTESSTMNKEYELLKRELEIVKREKELLEKENELYRKMKEFEIIKQIEGENNNLEKNNNDNCVNNDGAASSNGDVKNSSGRGETNGSYGEGAKDSNSEEANDSENGIANDSGNGETNNNDRENRRLNDSGGLAGVNDNEDRKAGEVQVSNTNVSFALLRELLPEYDGSVAPSIFVAQIKNIQTLYSVDVSTMKALLMSKARGKVQCWLNAKSNFIHDNFDQLLEEMITLFGEKESKLNIRRKFETRRWQFGEEFLAYFNSKVFLADRLGVPEDELIDYIIDGIPDKNLRMHANLQCFQNKTQLLMAFSKISLQKPPVNKDKRDTGVRCYNCNCLGHYAGECQKPKRDAGACYGCGSMGHLVATCPERKVGVAKNA